VGEFAFLLVGAALTLGSKGRSEQPVDAWTATSAVLRSDDQEVASIRAVVAEQKVGLERRGNPESCASGQDPDDMGSKLSAPGTNELAHSPR